jgi:uncharacterized protein YaaQ
MKLIIMIVQDSDALKLMDTLIESEFSVTKMSSTGGFLRRGNTTLMVGVEDEMLDMALKIVEGCCKMRKKITMPISTAGLTYAAGVPMEVNVGGAVCFIMDCNQKKF